MKKTIFRILAIAVCGLLLLFFAVLFVLSMIPKKNETGLLVSERLTVTYSEQAKDSGTYIHQLSGRIFNDSGKTVAIRSVEVSVTGKDGERSVIAVENVALLPRTEQEIFLEWTDVSAYDHVRQIRAVTDTGEEFLPNGTGNGGISAGTIGCGFLMLLFGVLLLWNIRQYRYGLEEEKMKSAQNGKSSG